jgi:hypothetical protein
MESEDSLPRSLQPDTTLFLEPTESSPYPDTSIHFNIIRPSAPGLSEVVSSLSGFLS